MARCAASAPAPSYTVADPYVALDLQGVTEAMLGAAKREGRELPDMEAQKELEAESLRVMIERMRKGWKNRYLQEDKVTLIAPDLAAQLADRSSSHRTPLIEFFRALAICHGVVADKDPDNAFLIDYKAESPDGVSTGQGKALASSADAAVGTHPCRGCAGRSGS
jgi:hypothetical protein